MRGAWPTVGRMSVVLLAIGVALLYTGGEALVRNARVLARAWGLSPMAVGLTVVAFGTSAPELAASLAAALHGSPEIAVGNVIGSNIANTALVLPLAALLLPLRTEARFLRRELPIMVGVALLLTFLLIGGVLGRLEGFLFVALLGAYLWFLLRDGESPKVREEFQAAFPAGRGVPAWRSGIGVLLGLGLLVGGAELLVSGAVSIARALSVPELVIGLTMVAIGTSLPELAAAIVAAVRRETEIVLGNIVGSSILNILVILGVTVLVRPIQVPFVEVAPDLAVMLGVSLLLWPFLASGLRLGRREGIVLLLLYSLYVGYRFVA